MPNGLENAAPAPGDKGGAFARPLLLAASLFLVVVSAAVVESDAYRYAAVILYVWGMATYLRGTERPPQSWMGLVCIGWSLYVALRCLAIYVAQPASELGSAEGIYLFPFLYPAIGYMMFRHRAVLWPAAVIFMLASLVVCALTLDPVAALGSGRHDFLLMNNLIHSSVGGGLVLIAAVNLTAYAARQPGSVRRRGMLIALGAAAVLLFAIGLYGAKSKGAWAALGIALIVQAWLSIGALSGRRRMMALAALAIVGAIALALAGPSVWETISPTVRASASIAHRVWLTGDPAASLRAAISLGMAPEAMTIRLMLWHDAIAVWMQRPLLGHGIAWREVLVASRYGDSGFTVVHNAYLEVAMRYGLVGLGFFAALYVWTVVVARRAARLGLVSPEAFRTHAVGLVFFAVTLFTNSNNRLAIGEAAMMAFGAFGFFCFFVAHARTPLAPGRDQTSTVSPS